MVSAEDGTCNFSTNADDVNFGDLIDGDCVWNENDDATDVDGNLIVEMDVLQGFHQADLCMDRRQGRRHVRCGHCGRGNCFGHC